MNTLSGKTALVTGGSSGIGKETVKKLLNAGVKVYTASRRTEKMIELEDMGAFPMAMDLSDEVSIKAVAEFILQKEGSIDILVNNAGYGSYGAIEDVPISEARRQFEVNIFGLVSLIQLVLPEMRKNNYGKIVNISSMAGKIHSPFGGWYHATKHSLEALSDCLRLETEPFGINTIIIEPGGIKTGWGIIAAGNLRKTSEGSPYSVRAGKSADRLEKMYRGNSLSAPGEVAETIMKALSSRKPKTRYPVGHMAKPSIMAKKHLGDRTFDRLISSFL